MAAIDTFRSLFRRLAPTAALLLALAACGGGGGGADSDTPSPPPDRTEATVGAPGAVLEVTELSLTLPPKALGADVAVSVGKLAPAAGEIARYAVSPAGLSLKERSEIRFERAGLAANARFFWEVDGELWMVPTTRNGNVLTARLSSLGYTLEGSAAARQGERAGALAARLQAGTPASANLVVQVVDCRFHAFQLAVRMNQALGIGEMALAIGVAEDIAATEAACDQLDIQVLEQRSCDVLAAAVGQAELFVAKDFAEFTSLTTPLFAAKAFVQQSGATCTPIGPERVDALVQAKFEQFASVLESKQLRGDFAKEAGRRELDELLAYDADCQRLGLTSSCTRLTDVILPNLLDGMRSSAFDACRASGVGVSVAALHALGSGTSTKDSFMGAARFGSAALEADMAYCADPTLDLKVFDNSSGIPDEMTDRAQTMRPLVGLGSYNIGTDVEVPRSGGSLTVGGRVVAPRCADGSLTGSELVVRIGAIEIKRLPAVGDLYTLATQPLDLLMSRVLPDAGLDPEKVTGFKLEFFREGGQCVEPSGIAFAAPFKMFEIRVNLGASLPKVIVLQGPVNFSFNSTETDALFQVTVPRRKVTSVVVAARVEETAGGLVGFVTALGGTVIETRSSLREFEVNKADGSRCTYEHLNDREDTTTFVAGGGRSLSLDLRFGNGELSVGEFQVEGPTSVTIKETVTLRNQTGACSDVNTSPPPPSTFTFERRLRLNGLFSLKNDPAFRAPVVTDANGRRSVALSGQASDTAPTTNSGLTVSQNTAFEARLADAPK